MTLHIIEEGHPGKIAGVYTQESGAKHAIHLLQSEGGFSADEVTLVPPNDANFGEKIEPDNKGIARTLLGSHIILGVGGLIFGLIMAAILSLYGPTLTTSSPLMVFIALPTLGVFIGLLAAGAVALRPDHDPLINQTRHATNHDKWTVVVQTKDHEQRQQAKKLMETSATSIAETL